MVYCACKVMVDVTLDASRVGCDVSDEVFRIVQDQLMGKIINKKAVVVFVQRPDKKCIDKIGLDPLSGKPMGSVPVTVVVELAVKGDVELTVATQLCALGIFASTGACNTFSIKAHIPSSLNADEERGASVWTTGTQADAAKVETNSLMLQTIMSGGESRDGMGYICSMQDPGCLLL